MTPFIKVVEKTASLQLCFRHSLKYLNHASQSTICRHYPFRSSCSAHASSPFQQVLSLAPPLAFAFCSGPLRVIQAQKLLVADRLCSALCMAGPCTVSASISPAAAPNHGDWLAGGGLRTTRAAFIQPVNSHIVSSARLIIESLFKDSCLVHFTSSLS